MIRDPLHGQCDFALERDARANRVQPLPELRRAFLHRIEEDAVHAQGGDHLAEHVQVPSALPARVDVPWIVVDVGAQAGSVQLLHNPPQARQPPGLVAVEVELVALIEPDPRIRMPQEDTVESAASRPARIAADEAAARLAARNLRRFMRVGFGRSEP